MRNRLLKISVPMFLIGTAGTVGNLETDMPLILPITMMIIGAILFVVWKAKKFKNGLEEERRVNHSYTDNARPHYLPN